MLFTSCQDQERSTAPLVADSVMVRIMADLHVADAGKYLDAREADWPSTLEDGTPTFTMGATRDSILDAHGVSDERFRRQLDFLVEDPGRLLALYEQVLDELNVRASR